MAAPNEVPAQPGAHAVREAEEGFGFVLSQPAFRLIWFSQLASQIADKFLMFSLLILAYQLGGGSSQVAFIMLAYNIPALVFGPLAGVFADRHDRKVIMVSANLLRGGLVALVPIAAVIPFVEHDFWHLLVLTFAISATGQVFTPAEAATIPTVLPRRALLTANSLVMVTLVLTLVIGGTLAPIFAGIHLYVPYWISALLFAAAGLCIWLAEIPKFTPERGPAGTHPFLMVWNELVEGVQFLRNSPVLQVGFGQLSVAVLVLMLMWTLAPAYVNTVLGISSQESYTILVPAMLGAIVSGSVLRTRGDRLNRPQLLFWSLMAMGVTLVLLAGVPSAMRLAPALAPYRKLVGVVFSFILGLEFGSLMIPALTYLMENSNDRVRGRIFALLFMVINGVAAIPIVLAAALSDLFGTSWVVAGMGVLVAGSGFLAVRYARLAFEPART